MKNSKIIMLLLILLFSAVCSLFSLESESPNTSSLLREFISKTGFTGDTSPVLDGRIFSKISGKFSLPEPRDSITLCSNTDFIANTLNAIYLKNGASYTLKRVSYRRDSQSCQYIQYWKNFCLVNQPFYLLITYHPDTSTYTINNTLYMLPVEIPDKVISPDTAKNIFTFLFNDGNMNPEISSIPLEYTSTDTLRNSFEYSTGDDYARYLTLGLYPLLPDDKTSGFLLQWKYPEPLYYDGSKVNNFLLNAATGELRANALKRWQKREPAIKAAKDFILKAGFIGNCNVYFSSYSDIGINFTDIVLTNNSITDSSSFHKYSKKLADLILDMYRQIGYDFQLEYKKTQDTEDSFYSIYYQSFRYQVYPEYSEFPNRVTISYSKQSSGLQIETSFFSKPISYPDKVVSPQTMLDLYILSKVHANNTNEYRKAVSNYPVKYVSANSIPHDNVYRDKKYHLTARLCMRPVMNPESEIITDIKPAWYVVSDYEDYGIYYNPATGKYQDEYYNEQSAEPDSADIMIRNNEQKAIAIAFADLGKTSFYDYDTSLKQVTGFTGEFNLPEPQDSVRLMSNYATLFQYICKYQGLNLNDFSYVTDRNFYPSDYSQKAFRLCYKGIEISSTQVIFSYQNSYSITYNISSRQLNKLPVMPEYVITPETALNLIRKDDSMPVIWTEISALSGNVNYAPPELYTPAEETARGNEFRGSVVLQLYPIKIKDSTANDYVYKLVWLIYPYGGAEFIIDAATGEILSENHWDTC
jgi:hypothetical protein